MNAKEPVPIFEGFAIGGIDVHGETLVADEGGGGNDDATAVMRSAASMPDTKSARDNHASLLRASQDAGYGQIGRAVGRDKSWVCRYLQAQGTASLSELLHWLDAAGLKISDAEASVGADQELMTALIARLSDDIDAHDRDAERSASKITIDKGLYDALTLLARRATVFMSERSK